jgi:hypothetical protein
MWSSGGIAPCILNFGINGDGGQLHTGLFILHKRDSGTNWIGRWVDSRASVDVVAKRKVFPSMPRSF